MKHYVVVYLSPGGMHYRYRCYAKSKRIAMRMCTEDVGIAYSNITEVYIEE